MNDIFRHVRTQKFPATPSLRKFPEDTLLQNEVQMKKYKKEISFRKQSRKDIINIKKGYALQKKKKMTVITCKDHCSI